MTMPNDTTGVVNAGVICGCLRNGGLRQAGTAWHYGGMPKRIRKKVEDPKEMAAGLLALSVEDTPRDPEVIYEVMAEMGRKGGKIGGKRRLKTMTAKQRKAAASKASKARWGGKK